MLIISFPNTLIRPRRWRSPAGHSPDAVSGSVSGCSAPSLPLQLLDEPPERRAQGLVEMAGELSRQPVMADQADGIGQVLGPEHVRNPAPQLDPDQVRERNGGDPLDLDGLPGRFLQLLDRDEVHGNALP